MLAVKHWHDPAGGWVLDPFVVATQVPLIAMLPGIAGEALAVGDAGTASAAERAAIGILAAGFVVCMALVQVRAGTVEGGPWMLPAVACLWASGRVFERLDGRDGGGRGDRLGAGYGKFCAGSGAVFAALAFMSA